MFLQVPLSNHLKGNTASGKIAMILSKSPLQLLGTGQPEPCSPSDFLIDGNTASGKIAMILSKSPLQLLGTGQPDPCSPSDFLINVRRNCQDNNPGEDSSSLINN
ncbi:hypothetical protein SLEP1_g38321 [Rubroshorea leprosula]|nr:hypothetical protein SLEP1_g38321 [Rubroshorea leprosula]